MLFGVLLLCVVYLFYIIFEADTVDYDWGEGGGGKGNDEKKKRAKEYAENKAKEAATSAMAEENTEKYNTIYTNQFIQSYAEEYAKLKAEINTEEYKSAFNVAKVDAEKLLTKQLKLPKYNTFTFPDNKCYEQDPWWYACDRPNFSFYEELLENMPEGANPLLYGLFKVTNIHNNDFVYREQYKDVFSKIFNIVDKYIYSFYNESEKYIIGEFYIKNLDTLNTEFQKKKEQCKGGLIQQTIEVCNLSQLQANPENAFSVFEMKSRFDCICTDRSGKINGHFAEIKNTSITKNTNYEQNVNTLPSLLYRNYKNATTPINTIEDIDLYFKTKGIDSYYNFDNNYRLIVDFENKDTIKTINKLLDTPNEYNMIKSKLKYGVQYQTQVVSSDTTPNFIYKRKLPQLITQVFLPVPNIYYGSKESCIEEPLYKLIVKANYEAIILITILNHLKDSINRNVVYILPFEEHVSKNETQDGANKIMQIHNDALNEVCLKYAEYNIIVRKLVISKNITMLETKHDDDQNKMIMYKQDVNQYNNYIIQKQSLSYSKILTFKDYTSVNKLINILEKTRNNISKINIQDSYAYDRFYNRCDEYINYNIREHENKDHLLNNKTIREYIMDTYEKQYVSAHGKFLHENYINRQEQELRPKYILDILELVHSSKESNTRIISKIRNPNLSPYNSELPREDAKAKADADADVEADAKYYIEKPSSVNQNANFGKPNQSAINTNYYQYLDIEETTEELERNLDNDEKIGGNKPTYCKGRLYIQQNIIILYSWRNIISSIQVQYRYNTISNKISFNTETPYKCTIRIIESFDKITNYELSLIDNALTYISIYNNLDASLNKLDEKRKDIVSKINNHKDSNKIDSLVQTILSNHERKNKQKASFQIINDNLSKIYLDLKTKTIISLKTPPLDKNNYILIDQHENTIADQITDYNNKLNAEQLKLNKINKEYEELFERANIIYKFDISKLDSHYTMIKQLLIKRNQQIKPGSTYNNGNELTDNKNNDSSNDAWGGKYLRTSIYSVILICILVLVCIIINKRQMRYRRQHMYIQSRQIMWPGDYVVY